MEKRIRSFEITEQMAAALRRTAYKRTMDEDRYVSVSEIIRTAVEQYLKDKHENRNI